MKKKILDLAVIGALLLSLIITLTGCGKKVEEKIVCAKIIIQTNEKSGENQAIIPNSAILSTYENFMNSKSIKTAIEKEYGTIGNVKIEEIEDTEIVKVSYVCDNLTDEKYKKMLNDWIEEFSKKANEIYDVNIYIIEEPQINTRLVTK